MLGRFLTRSHGQAAPESAPPPPPGTDPVTGLPDRRLLAPATKAAIEHSLVTSTRAAVVFVGLGLLQDVNDSYGPDAGDFLLTAVAERLRSIDVPDTQVMRYNAAEFALVFEKVANTDMCGEIAAFVVELLNPPFDIGHERISITSHVGVAISSDKYDTLDALLGDAHEALVKARERGHGAWHVHDETRRGRYSTRVDEQRLRDALDNEEFFLLYQPIVRVDTFDIVGVEALLRWRAPQATNVGLLYPHEFMPLLEKSGLSVAVGAWVLQEACRQATSWDREQPERDPLLVTCNLGPRQLASVEFRQSVVSAIEASGALPTQICLELTEEALRHNRNASWSSLRDLKDMGVKLSLDDFGTGVASLTYLRQLNLDLLHIDRTFLAGLEHSQEDQAIIANISRLCHDLGITVIAQGVEDEKQAGMLQSLGVDLAQGFYFGKPETAEEISHRIVGDTGATPSPESGDGPSDAVVADASSTTDPAAHDGTATITLPSRKPDTSG